MSEALFLEFKTGVEAALPGVRTGQALAMTEMAEAHENQIHLLGLNRGLAYAWRVIASECPDAKDEHRSARLNCEIEFDDEDLSVGLRWLPVIRQRIAADITPGRWTGTIAPNDTDFVEAWLRHHEKQDAGNYATDGWAGALISDYCDENLSVSWEMTQCLLKHHTTEWQLCMLGFGPLENMLWKHVEEAVDLIAPAVPGNERLAYALAHVWISDKEPRGEYTREYWAKRLADLGVKTESRPPPFLAI